MDHCKGAQVRVRPVGSRSSLSSAVAIALSHPSKALPSAHIAEPWFPIKLEAGWAALSLIRLVSLTPGPVSRASHVVDRAPLEPRVLMMAARSKSTMYASGPWAVYIALFYRTNVR